MLLLSQETAKNETAARTQRAERAKAKAKAKAEARAAKKALKKSEEYREAACRDQKCPESSMMCSLPRHADKPRNWRTNIKKNIERR